MPEIDQYIDHSKQPSYEDTYFQRPHGMQINIGELEAVIYGLSAAIDYGFHEMMVFTDSKTVYGWLRKIFADRKCTVGGGGIGGCYQGRKNGTKLLTTR